MLVAMARTYLTARYTVETAAILRIARKYDIAIALVENEHTLGRITAEDAKSTISELLRLAEHEMEEVSKR